MLNDMFPHVPWRTYLWGPAILAVVSLSVPTTAASASADTIYRFVDAHGVLHFSNVPTDPRYKKIRSTSRPAQTVPSVLTVPSFALNETIRVTSQQHNLSPALVHAVIRAESAYNPHAVSPKGAMGLMQLMPETAAMLKVSNPYDAADNISGGVRYLRHLLDRFGGDLELALAAYNAGESRVWRENQIPQIIETRQYVRKVLRVYRHLAQEGTDTSRFVNYLSHHAPIH